LKTSDNKQLRALAAADYRKNPPAIQSVEKLVLHRPEISQLSNQIPVFETRLGSQEALRLELVFASGRAYEEKWLSSRLTARMLREGTQNQTAAQIANTFDFYAGTWLMPVNQDFVTVGMYCLTKHFDQLLPLIAEILQAPVFPEKEIKTYTQNSAKDLQIDLTKNDVVAYRKITEYIFGENHPYGYSSTPDDYNAILSEDLKKFHKTHFVPENCQIFVGGKTNDAILQKIEQYFGKTPPTNAPKPSYVHPFDVQPREGSKNIRLKHTEKSTQTAIRIGRRFGKRTHPDYVAFYMLNIVLGGYFGSRLMSNIREKKGYTYNIYSNIDLMLEDGYFYISSEVGNAFVAKTLKEIYSEIEILKTELVPETELQMVKNYILGNMLNTIDGAFAVMNVVKSLQTEGLSFDMFENFIMQIRQTTSEEIRQMAQKYLNRADLFEVII
jgi:zinc protease